MLLEKTDIFTDFREMFLSFNLNSIPDETERILKLGISPKDLLKECQSIMEIVGDKYEREEYFLPELVVSGEIFKVASAKIKDFGLGNDGTNSFLYVNSLL